jgi:hypothetical protein
MQSARRINPYPWTWEVPVAAVTLLLAVMTVAAHGARAVANVFAGGDWEVPARARLFSSIPGLLGGDASAGLSSSLTSFANSHQLWWWIGIVESLVIVAAAMALRWGMARWGPGRILGMATAAEVDRLLGQARLRRSAAVVRPDLYGCTGTS